jgi:hypothetical protein
VALWLCTAAAAAADNHDSQRLLYVAIIAASSNRYPALTRRATPSTWLCEIDPLVSASRILHSGTSPTYPAVRAGRYEYPERLVHVAIHANRLKQALTAVRWLDFCLSSPRISLALPLQSQRLPKQSFVFLLPPRAMMPATSAMRGTYPSPGLYCFNVARTLQRNEDSTHVRHRTGERNIC